MSSEEETTLSNIPTHILVQQQLQDVILTQQDAYDRLKRSIAQKGETVPLSKYEAVVKDLEDEQIAHAQTKAKLMAAEDKLEFALGEIEILQKQIDREKSQFEKTFGSLKTKALKECVKTVQLENKCHVMQKESTQQTSVLDVREHQVASLSEQLRSQQDSHRQQMTELNLQKQQEVYIAQVLDGRDKRKVDTTKPSSVKHRTVKNQTGYL